MKKFLKAIWKPFEVISCAILNIFTRVVDLLIKILSMKGIILAMSFYLTLKLQTDIWAFVMIASWIIGSRQMDKNKNGSGNLMSSAMGMKSKIMTWAMDLKTKVMNGDVASNAENGATPPSDA
jgi:hypothetical protein